MGTLKCVCSYLSRDIRPDQLKHTLLRVPIRMHYCRIPATDGVEFWINCKRPAFFSSFSLLQVIQNKRPWSHCTEIDFALSFGAVMVKMIDLSKTGTRDFFDIILDQKNAQDLYLLPKSCYKSTTRLHFSLKWANFFIRFG